MTGFPVHPPSLAIQVRLSATCIGQPALLCRTFQILDYALRYEYKAPSMQTGKKTQSYSGQDHPKVADRLHLPRAMPRLSNCQHQFPPRRHEIV